MSHHTPLALNHLRDVNRSNFPDLASLLARKARNGDSARRYAGGAKAGVGSVEGDGSVRVFLSGDGARAAIITLSTRSPACRCRTW